MILNLRKGLFCAAIAATMMATAVQADDLLVVDLSVPNQVTISATSGLSAANASGGDTTGVYLENFYGGSGNPLSAPLVSGDLTNAENPSDLSPSIFRATGGADTGLNVFSFSSDSTVTFTAGSLAFVGSGTWTLDPDEYADMLAGTTSGDLYFPADSSDDIAGATLIGTWTVIPEPGTIALLGLGVIGLIRRRR